MNKFHDITVKENSTTNYPKPIFQNKGILSFSIDFKRSLNGELLEESILLLTGFNRAKQIFRSKLGFCDFLRFFLLISFITGNYYI